MKLHSLLVLLALALSQVLTAQVNYQEVKSAAENGDIESMNTLGVIYFSGELVPRIMQRPSIGLKRRLIMESPTP